MRRASPVLSATRWSPPLYPLKRRTTTSPHRSKALIPPKQIKCASWQFLARKIWSNRQKRTRKVKLKLSKVTSVHSSVRLTLLQPKRKYFHSANISIQTCGNSKHVDFVGGFRCNMCEYDLCVHCSVVFCRYGHQMRIWTMPEAIAAHCDLCKREFVAL